MKASTKIDIKLTNEITLKAGSIVKIDYEEQIAFDEATGIHFDFLKDEVQVNV